MIYIGDIFWCYVFVIYLLDDGSLADLPTEVIAILVIAILVIYFSDVYW